MYTNIPSISNEHLPLVSIITVTLNAKKHIEQCITSVLSLQYPRIEFFVMDGGSTDGTLEILKKYSDKIKWHSEPDKGVYNAMNKAIEYVQGEWILFLGADDTLLSGFSTMAYQLKDDRTIYYGRHKWKGSFRGRECNAYHLTKENVCHQSIFYPAAVFRKYRYNEKYLSRADHVLNMQCWGDKSFVKKYIPIIIADYAPGGFSAHNPDTAYHNDKPRLVAKHLGPLTYLRYKIKCYKNKRKGMHPDPDLLW